MDSYDFDIFQGSSFSLGVTLRDGDQAPINLSGYSVSGLLKFKYSDASYLTNLNATKQAPYASGYITLSIPSTGTAALPVTVGFYDVELYHNTSGTTDKVLRGKASIYPEVTY